MHTRCSYFALITILLALSTATYAYDDEGWESAGFSDDSRDYSYNYSGASRETQEDYPQYAYSDGYYNQGNYYNDGYYRPRKAQRARNRSNYTPSMPQQISSGEKVIVVDPRRHVWGAYLNGKLIRSGLATAGAKWCSDIGRPCRTRSGVFRIQSLGSASCKSTRYPVGEGGAPMPYCMYFNGNQGLHGSYQVVAGNISHGCVRMRVDDARWLRYNFANIGTKVIVKPY